jgi:malonyl-CoA O-methyltransferase
MSSAKSALPPTLDAQAARKWLERPRPQAAWLSEEVARRMQQRLDWIRQVPQTWAHWHPCDSGFDVQVALRQRYPKAACWLVEPSPQRANLARLRLREPWWRSWQRGALHTGQIPEAGVDMVWANMLLHHSAQPLDLLGLWQQALATDGFVMFSALGPDSLRQLHAVYHHMGWGPPGPDLTDMHDWGDMLLEAGFAQPVMDMERITLTYASAWDMLQDLRTLGRNTRADRFAACRGKGWRQAWLQAVEQWGERSDSDGRLQLVFEVIYGHAIKPLPRVPMGGESTVSLRDMRTLLGRANSR